MKILGQQLEEELKAEIEDVKDEQESLFDEKSNQRGWQQYWLRKRITEGISLVVML